MNDIERDANKLDLELFNARLSLERFVSSYTRKLTRSQLDRFQHCGYDIDALRGHIRVFMNEVDLKKTSGNEACGSMDSI